MRRSYLSRLSEVNKQVIVLLAGVVTVGAIFCVWMLLGGASNVEWWKGLGYPGVFLLSLLGSGGMVFPIPGIAATCGAAGLSLNLVVVGIFCNFHRTCLTGGLYSGESQPASMSSKYTSSVSLGSPFVSD